ncbi:kanadaptin [Athalia rosae]|uniref:kanadaptin n=1 Tax=Athalia rosae TaxID=37344 RepID=UPI0020337B81|nr:kanadaptin [Athalia rosae]XP_048509293.1 kanadaptin [Athalia rosae]
MDSKESELLIKPATNNVIVELISTEKCAAASINSENLATEKNNASHKLNDPTEALDTKETTALNEQEADCMENTENSDQQKALSFKTPHLLIGPRKRKLGKLRTLSHTSSTVKEENKDSPEKLESVHNTEEEAENEKEPIDSNHPKQEQTASLEIPKEKQVILPYREPVWGGVPLKKYKLEILKSGVILETVDLTQKSYYVFGRLPVCDIPLAHPTISRYHAVIQYRLKGDDKNPMGLYLYDLGSTHGSFWNGHRMKSNMYVRLRSGHMIRFGCSQRKFIIHGPTEDEEEETELTLTELKENRRLELAERERREREELLRIEEEKRLRKEKEENEGIDWGMGEDADEETDLSENPYAATNNEELFLDDPKKTLRGWFEREGFDLQYQTEEKGIGQFLCWVDLPIDNITGKSIRAEALVKGKKKESVIQCALEACRILDRHGVLRQAHHEARKRKAKNWEEEDFYDSDEDNFLDRTGSIEKKRLQRMRMAGKLEDTVETYTSLLEKHKAVVKQITDIEKNLHSAQKQKVAEVNSSDEDALDTFMSNLNSVVPNKSETIKMKLELQTLRKEEMRLINLVNIAKPANLPPLKPQKTAEFDEKRDKKIIKASPLIGTKNKLKPLKTSTKLVPSSLHDAEDKNEANEDAMDVSEYETELIEAYKSKLVEHDRLDNVDKVTEVRSSPSEITDSQQSVTKCEEKKMDELAESNSSKEEERIKEELDLQKRKKRNQKRMQQRMDKAEKEKQKGYQEDKFKEDYSMWIPPQDQTGDGKTNLNDKFGY